MKPSHRKDVIIARIIFVVFCVIVIAIVSGIIVSVVNHFKVNTQPETQATESEQTVDQLPPNVPDTDVVERDDIYVKTTSSVNMRAAASKDSEVLTVLAKDSQLQLLSETDGWAEVIYDNKKGYVSTDYIVEIGIDYNGNTESTTAQ